MRMNVDISLLLHSLVIGFVSLLAVSMICLAAGQRIVAANAVRKTSFVRQQRVLAESRTKLWSGNTPTFRR